MKTIKKSISFIIALMLVLSVLPMSSVLAEESGTTGDCTWVINGDVLTISGNGATANYGTFDHMPWEYGVETVIVEEGVTAIGDKMFSESWVEEITLPSTLKTIGKEAFFCARHLIEITIPEGVTSIGEGAFNTCDRLETVSIPASLTTMGKKALFSCESLANINVDENNAYFSSIDGSLFNKDKTVILKYGIGKTNTSYDIPNSVKTIGERAFAGCLYLENVNIPDSVNSIEYLAFGYCEKVAKFDIPNSVTTIKDHAFAYCWDLAVITIPASVKTIGENILDWLDAVTIICSEGSAIQNYATENNLKYEIVSVELDSIEINSLPTKLNYIYGEDFEMAGLGVKLNYSDGSSEIITEGFDLTGFDRYIMGEQIVTVSYKGQIASFAIQMKWINKGDMNFDDMVDVKDLIALKKYMANDGELNYAFDLNNDSKLDATDIAKLKQTIMWKS